MNPERAVLATVLILLLDRVLDMLVVKHAVSIVFSLQNVLPIKFCRDLMVSCEIASPGLQLLSQLRC